MNKAYIKIIAAVVISVITAVIFFACNNLNNYHEFDKTGAIVRCNVGEGKIYWVFSADSLFEGGNYALDVLKSKNVKASFFFTGNFLRNSRNNQIIQRVINSEHYLGPHGDKHIQLADWDDTRTPLVSNDSLIQDIENNYEELKRWGVSRSECNWFMPSYEWITSSQTQIIKERLKLKVVTPTPGIVIYRDYTVPYMKDYFSSDSILRQLYRFEREKGLDGAILIMHLGTQQVRTDKLYNHLPEIIDSLRSIGYEFERFY